MIAEVSYPSTGLGMELAWADAANIPILCIHKMNCIPSSSVTNLCGNVISYKNVGDMIRKISQWIQSYGD